MANKHNHRRNYNDPGHAHELTFSCYQGFNFLDSQRTCQWLVEAIEQASQRLRFHVWAYFFMPEHVHLLIWPQDAEYDIAEIRKAIKASVAIQAIRYLSVQAPEWIPRITRTRGQKSERLFWQSGGGYDRNVISGTTLLKMIDYIHLNPVRRGLVDRPELWKWSSAAWYLGAREVPLAMDPIPAEWLDGSL